MCNLIIRITEWSISYYYLSRSACGKNQAVYYCEAESGFFRRAKHCGSKDRLSRNLPLLAVYCVNCANCVCKTIVAVQGRRGCFLKDKSIRVERLDLIRTQVCHAVFVLCVYCTCITDLYLLYEYVHLQVQSCVAYDDIQAQWYALWQSTYGITKCYAYYY